MKILHIGHAPLPTENPLGSKVSKYAYYPGRWVLNLAKAQRIHTSAQVEILIKVPGGNGVWTTDIEGIPCHFVSVPNLLRGKTGFFLDQRILASQALLKQPDMVHAHGTEEANALAALRTGLPCILTLQGCFFIINRIFRPRLLSRQWIVEKLERKTIPRFKHIITKSRYLRDEVLSVFPNVFTNEIPNTYDLLLEKIDPLQKRMNAVAFVGTIDPRKGFDIILEALITLFLLKRNLPVFHIFGNQKFPEAWESTQLDAAKNLLGKNLILHGQVPQIQVANEVAKCRALVAPSREEMYGNQVIESLIVGTHVIVTENTAMAENVKRFGNGTIVPQNDPRKTAEAIHAALSFPLDYQISCATRKLVIEECGPQKVATRHATLYEKVSNFNK